MKVKRILRCKCGSSRFSFRWEYEEEDETRLLLCHDGFGFQFTDSIIKCAECGIESVYEEETFLEMEDLTNV